MAVEETAAGLRSPEMMVTGLNQHLVMSALNSELLDYCSRQGTPKELIQFQTYFDISDYSYLIYLILCSCVVSCFLAVILGLTLRDMMTFPLRPQDTTVLTTLKV